MKKTIKTIVAAILLIASAMSLAACGKQNIYDSLADDGYTVKVRFDASGAYVNDTQNVSIVEVYNEEDAVTNSAGKTGVALLAPDDPLRKTAQFKLAKIDGTYNYFQIGWYRERTPIVDANGNQLDVFGELVSESKREPAYTYSGKWDFANDVVTGNLDLVSKWHQEPINPPAEDSSEDSVASSEDVVNSDESVTESIEISSDESSETESLPETSSSDKEDSADEAKGCFGTLGLTASITTLLGACIVMLKGKKED
jgi:hypothetical protein